MDDTAGGGSGPGGLPTWGAVDQTAQIPALVSFCPNCGTQRGPGPFCPHCGTPAAGAAPVSRGPAPPPPTDRFAPPPSAPPPSTVPPSSLPPSTLPYNSPTAAADAVSYVAPTERKPRAAKIALVVLAAILVFGAAAGGTLLATQDHKTAPVPAAYRSVAAGDLAPVLSANTEMVSALDALSPGADTHPAAAALGAAQAAIQSAQPALAALRVPPADSAFAEHLTEALSAELAWIQAATADLATPSSPQVSQLSALGADAQTKLALLAPNVPGAAGAKLPSDRIVAYAAAAVAATQTTTATTQFSDAVSALLDQSASSFQTINTLFGQLQTAANGGYATITLAQAEQQISGVVANRTALAAAAAALNATTPQAQAVRADLAAAFSASLKDDTDIDNCLNQANNGTVAVIFEGCVSSTASDSQAATAAKQQFLAAYNQLRATIGQPAVSPQF